VTTVAGVAANVTTVAGISANVTTVAGISANVTTVAGSIANVNTVATNLAGVNSFAERYRVESSDPSTSLDAGDLAFNTTSSLLKYYNGTSWQSIAPGIGAVADDSTPQLGGALDTNGNNITFGDNDKAIFGAGSDLQIFHDGSNSWINEVGTGQLILAGEDVRITTPNAGEFMATFGVNGAATLYYDNAIKLATTSTGIDVTGVITADDRINIESASGFASIEMGGPSGAYIDMKTPFSDDYDGRFQYADNQLMLITNADEPVQLRHNNTTRFATTSVGVDVTGELVADSYNETYAAVTSSSNATTVNCENANSFSHTLTENTTFTFSNPPASGTSYTFSIEIIQDASASGFTVTWPSSVDWPAATAPTLTATASAKDIFVFTTRDSGTTWYGFTAGQALG
jgi:hypothetical protein